ncbi:ABC transporter permease [Candidatus Omnitrophota bacterium]
MYKVMSSIIKEISDRRNLIKALVLKDLKIRYSRPMLGFFWTLLAPFLMVIIFYIIFSFILRVNTTEYPFFLYLMSSVFPWRFFHESLICSASSLVDNKNLIKESNFPHYLVPISIVLANLLNFLPSLVLLIAISFFILKTLPVFIVFVPIVLCTHLIITIGLSIVVSVLYVRWRDIKYILDAVLLFLFYLTPAIYSINLVKNSFPQSLFSIYMCNPFVGLVNLYRLMFLKGFYATVKHDVTFLNLIIIPVVFGVSILLLGFHFYRKNKNSINDYLFY